ncbi:hypothetical protein Tco_1520327, partial [Tanacetum coccineum]
MQTTHEPTTMPHDSPLPRVYSLRSDEGSMQQTELMDLVTKLTNRVEVLENDLQQTKKIYSSAITKLILRVKKLEKTVKSNKARRRARIVLSDVKEDVKDPSKQGRIIDEIDANTDITLVTPTKVSSQSDQSEDHLKVLSAAKVLADAARKRREVANVTYYTRRRRTISTASGDISTAEEPVITAGVVQETKTSTPSPVATKDKGKAIMQEFEPPKKIKKKVYIYMSLDEELAQKLHEEEHARFHAEQEELLRLQQEQEKYDLEKALELQKQLDKREEVVDKEAYDIDWSDLAVLRYHALQNRSFSVVEVRKNMCMYLK